MIWALSERQKFVFLPLYSPLSVFLSLKLLIFFIIVVACFHSCTNDNEIVVIDVAYQIPYSQICANQIDSFFVPNVGLSETAVMDLIANNLQQQRNMVEQLRREANIQRMPVSQACADIIKYVTEHEQEDCLLVGFSSQKVNPFREKSSCQIL